MPSIYVKKDKLLDILIKNRKRHIEVHAATSKIHKKAYIKKVKSMLKAAANNKFETYVNLTQPCNSKNSYDQAIKMTQLSSREEILLDNKEFRNYVMDKWGWTDTFVRSIYSNYSSSSSSSTVSSSSLSSGDLPATIRSYITEMERDNDFTD